MANGRYRYCEETNQLCYDYENKNRACVNLLTTSYWHDNPHNLIFPGDSVTPIVLFISCKCK